MKTAVTQYVIGCLAVPVCLVTFATPLAARESAVKVLTQVTEWDSNVDGIPEGVRSTTTTYDRQGNLLSTTYESEWYGTLTYRSITTNTYDQHRNLLTVEDEADWDGDGTVDRRSVTRSTYDSQGRLITQAVGREEQFVPVLTNSYDKKGNLLRTMRRYVDYDGTSGYRTVVTNTFDQRGRMVSRLVEQDSDANGTVDLSNTTRNTYVHGNLLTQLITGDIEFDWQTWVPATITIANSYDQQGNLFTSLTDLDYADGSSYRSTIANNYDQHRNLLHSVMASTGEGLTYVSDLTNSYDPQGNLLTQVEEFDEGGNGILEQRTISTNRYDQHRNVLKNVHESDSNGDGVADSASTITTSYDQHRNVLKSVYEWDWGVDGVADSVRITTNTYDRQGNLLTRVVEVDNNNDGTPDRVETTTMTYSDMAR